MTWFKVDDSFHSHPKVLASSPGALGLWVVAGAWCGANLTDGFVPTHALTRLLPDSAELAEELCTVGLWKRSKGGYRFHDWDDYNPNSSDVKKERDAARERMRNLRAKRKAPAQHANGSGEQQPNVRKNFADRSQPRPDPTRPDQEQRTPPPSAGPPEGGRTDRGARIPDDFTVTDDMATWARENAPLCGPTDHEAFCDYWRSTPGQKGRKLDWEKTWRNWMRKEQERRATKRSPAPAPARSTTDERVAQIQALKAEMFGTPQPPLNLIRGELA